jgi:glycosyltransferase involved in cell wall biosynthesis
MGEERKVERGEQKAAGQKTHVAALFARVGPYHFARLRAAGTRLRITAVEFSDVDLTYAWNLVEGQDSFDRVLLFPGAPVDSQPAARIFEVVEETLDHLRPDAVAIPGWYDRCSLAALKWCLRRAVPAIIMSETTAWDDERKPWRELVKRRVVRLCAAGLVGGKSHADYLAELGMPRERIFLGYDAVDNDYFAAKAEEVRRAESGERRGERGVRSSYGLPKQYFLSSARFVEKKNLARLIEAYAQYRKKSEDRGGKMGEGGLRDYGTTGLRDDGTTGLRDNRTTGLRTSEGEKLETRSPLSRSPVVSSPVVRSSVVSSPVVTGSAASSPWSLVLLGEGPLKTGLCHLISDLSLQQHVLLPGFKQYDELPVYYGLAGPFIHASTTEQWGLVVNEAMASGLPVLVSNRCGCAADLVREGANGFTFDPCNVEQLAQLMLKISASNFPLPAFGAASREIIAEWGPERFASGLQQAVEVAVSVPSPRARLLDLTLLKILMTRPAVG